MEKDRAAFWAHLPMMGAVIAGLGLLLFLADLAATRGPARTPESEKIARNQVIRALNICLEAEKTKEAPFVNGRDMMQLFGLEPGPSMGSLLKRLRELQDLGDITSKAEAIEAARQMLQAGEPVGGYGQNDD